MKPNTVVLGLLVSLGYGCATEVGFDDASPIGVTKAAVSGDDGAIHPGCDAFQKQCRAGNTKQCAKYSERCEVRIGVIGDSLSDEYQGFVGLPGVQWTEQVQADLRISLGAHETDDSERGEPRNDGYGLNWARFAQAALSIQWNTPDIQDELAAAGVTPDPRWSALGPFDAQIQGLGAQIAAGKVDVALVWIGHNDVFIRQFIGFGFDGGQQAFGTALVTRIVTAAAALRTYASADPKHVKAKVAIIGLAGTAGSAFNPSLSAAAANAGIAFIDPFNTAVNAIVTEQAGTGSFHVGDTALMPFTITTSPSFSATPKVANAADLSPAGTGPCGISPLTMATACSTPAYAEPFRQHDAVHPNTIYMGTIGNQIITDVNSKFGFAMRTIPDAELLDTAGL